MKQNRLSLLSLATSFALMLPASIHANSCTGTTIFINEIKYDPAGSDSSSGAEFVEVAGPAGTDITGFLLELVNGLNGEVYDTVTFPSSSTIPDQQNGFGTLQVATPGLQNGDSAPDGIALVDIHGGLLQFLSYEGSFAAGEGAANGITSVDILVEDAGLPADQSLQLVGTGNCPEDFAWVIGAIGSESFGNINDAQFFETHDTTTTTTTTTTTPPPPPVAEFDFFSFLGSLLDRLIALFFL